MEISKIFKNKNFSFNGVYEFKTKLSSSANQTNYAFSKKWKDFSKIENKSIEFSNYEKKQINWYLSLYGYKDKKHFNSVIKNKKIILDAGCGLGYKSAYIAKSAKNSLVIAMDASDSIYEAYKRFKNIKNLYFIKGDISKNIFKNSTFDLINCDQVLHHTNDVEKTLDNFKKISKKKASFHLYVYAKKSIPRELLDEEFRNWSKNLNHKQLNTLSEDVTNLGKVLSKIDKQIHFPSVELLGIKSKKQTVQRFIYDNFLKCFWNPDYGFEKSKLINYDWYAPSNAKRYSKKEFMNLLRKFNLKIDFLYEAPECFSGRFFS
jgi:ubiquinone/menaquinone biosynthesis C-methylase UbiE